MEGWYNLMRSLREYGKECENLRRNVVDWLVVNTWLKSHWIVLRTFGDIGSLFLFGKMWDYVKNVQYFFGFKMTVFGLVLGYNSVQETPESVPNWFGNPLGFLGPPFGSMERDRFWGLTFLVLRISLLPRTINYHKYLLMTGSGWLTDCYFW